jgi:uncharacterized RDD family membrane protein YckC
MSPTAKKERGLGEGVFYGPGDYAGFVTRCWILVIDTAVLIAAWFALGVVLWPDIDVLVRWFYLAWTCFALAYLTFIKASPLGTLGLSLTQTRIVTIRGKRPSFFRMIFRLFLWVLGPFNTVFDLIYLAGDRRKQSLRDKVAGTYVVRRLASPAGTGTIRLANLMILGLNLDYRAVKEPVHPDQRALPSNDRTIGGA